MNKNDSTVLIVHYVSMQEYLKNITVKGVRYNNGVLAADVQRFLKMQQ